jgi:hypothetical protein
LEDRAVDPNPMKYHGDSARQSIDAGLAMELQKERFQTRHLRVREPKEMVHVAACFSRDESER